MEKLILFLIVFGVGSFFEYLKKKREQRADSVAGKIFGSAQASETKARTVAQNPGAQAKEGGAQAASAGQLCSDSCGCRDQPPVTAAAGIA